MDVLQVRRQITYLDVVRDGACSQGVWKWCEERGVFVLDIDDISDVSASARPYILSAAHMNGYGYGDCYGGAYGYYMQ